MSALILNIIFLLANNLSAQAHTYMIHAYRYELDAPELSKFFVVYKPVILLMTRYLICKCMSKKITPFKINNILFS